MRKCRKCDCEINDGSGLGNRIKVVGKEKDKEWIFRHIKQLLSIFFNGFAKPEIEGYDEYCDECFPLYLEWRDTKPIKADVEE